MEKWAGILVLLLALLSGASAHANANAGSICNIDSHKLTCCLPAVSGNYSPPPPTKQCCFVLRHSNLPCLCSYKTLLPALGINPKHAFALPGKCGLKTPPECHVN
ncbi:Protease inhibitor/seed storage/lipid transfer protein family protein [Quillaja saponaria]|uniref:Protease inhibitor/seed storage/lipid transfer protein family protein n=1 Tax=Quillaja saponaria TaxID=32244 RepID=A0AAD7LT43_QUISA|nr:Protease inhibitor/seed storage/lipid transfer protein family protein [Quillaja saponaria]